MRRALQWAKGSPWTPIPIALMLGGIGLFFPDRWVWSHAVQALLLSCPRLLLLSLPIWAAVQTWRSGPRWKVAVALALGLGLSGWPVQPDAGEGLLVVSANVNAYSDTDNVGVLEQALAQTGAALVVVIEKRALQVPGLVRVADNFEDDLPRPSHAIAVFAREDLDLSAEITPEFGASGSQMPVALIRLRERCVLGIHSPPPVPFTTAGIGPYIDTIAEHIEDGRMASAWGPCEPGDPVVVLGDLNGVPWSRAYRVLRREGLSDPLWMRGVHALSWPAGGGWPNLPVMRLDHVLVGQTQVQGVHMFRVPGADHKALGLWLD